MRQLWIFISLIFASQGMGLERGLDHAEGKRGLGPKPEAPSVKCVRPPKVSEPATPAPSPEPEPIVNGSDFSEFWKVPFPPTDSSNQCENVERVQSTLESDYPPDQVAAAVAEVLKTPEFTDPPQTVPAALEFQKAVEEQIARQLSKGGAQPSPAPQPSNPSPQPSNPSPQQASGGPAGGPGGNPASGNSPASGGASPPSLGSGIGVPTAPIAVTPVPPSPVATPQTSRPIRWALPPLPPSTESTPASGSSANLSPQHPVKPPAVKPPDATPSAPKQIKADTRETPSQKPQDKPNTEISLAPPTKSSEPPQTPPRPENMAKTPEKREEKKNSDPKEEKIASSSSSGQSKPLGSENSAVSPFSELPKPSPQLSPQPSPSEKPTSQIPGAPTPETLSSQLTPPVPSPLPEESKPVGPGPLMQDFLKNTLSENKPLDKASPGTLAPFSSLLNEVFKKSLSETVEKNSVPAKENPISDKLKSGTSEVPLGNPISLMKSGGDSDKKEKAQKKEKEEEKFKEEILSKTSDSSTGPIFPLSAFAKTLLLPTPKTEESYFKEKPSDPATENTVNSDKAVLKPIDPKLVAQGSSSVTNNTYNTYNETKVYYGGGVQGANFYPGNSNQFSGQNPTSGSKASLRSPSSTDLAPGQGFAMSSVAGSSAPLAPGIQSTSRPLIPWLTFMLGIVGTLCFLFALAGHMRNRRTKGTDQSTALVLVENTVEKLD